VTCPRSSTTPCCALTMTLSFGASAGRNSSVSTLRASR
jgi:hypothetical protein